MSDLLSIFINFQVNLYVLLSAFPIAYLVGFIFASLGYATTGKINQTLSSSTFLVRGTPLVVQLVAVYFGLPFFGIYLSAEFIAISVFAVHYGAILAEKFRSSFLSLGKSAFKAGFALGMQRYQIFRWIFLPQVLITSLPAASNAAQGMLKDTAILSAISIMDAITTAKSISSITFNFFWPFLTMYACFVLSYLTITLFLNKVQQYIGVRYGQVV